MDLFEAVSPWKSLPDDDLGPLLVGIEEDCRRHADRPALSMRHHESLSYSELLEEAQRIAAVLQEMEIDRVAILSESRPEWVTTFLGGLFAGAVVVPLDAKLTVDELVPQLKHTETTLLVVSPALEYVANAVRARVDGLTVVSIEDRRQSFTRFRPVRRDDDDIALIVHTSGTTGAPKGVEISCGTLRFQREAVNTAIGAQSGERFLSILPLNHLYELICGLLTLIGRGASIDYAESLLPDDLTARMREQRTTSLVGVPLVYRILQRRIVKELRRRRLVRAWFAVASVIAVLLPPALRRRLMSPILRVFGGALRACYSGGAPLPVETARFFAQLGLPVYQGYGLSETGPVIATNTPAENRLGSVGRPLEGVEVRIARDGEILTRGPHLMRGYLGRPDLTAQLIDREGWLHTGDLGHLDEEGFLYVTGRAKELIVLGGGKKVHPVEVEELIAQSLEIQEVCVLAVPARSALLAGSDEVCAVVVPAEHVRDDALIYSEVERLCERVAPFKRPTRVVIRRAPLPSTTSKKVLRRELLEELS